MNECIRLPGKVFYCSWRASHEQHCRPGLQFECKPWTRFSAAFEIVREVWVARVIDSEVFISYSIASFANREALFNEAVFHLVIYIVNVSCFVIAHKFIGSINLGCTQATIFNHTAIRCFEEEKLGKEQGIHDKRDDCDWKGSSSSLLRGEKVRIAIIQISFTGENNNSLISHSFVSIMTLLLVPQAAVLFPFVYQFSIVSSSTYSKQYFMMQLSCDCPLQLLFASPSQSKN